LIRNKFKASRREDFTLIKYYHNSCIFPFSSRENAAGIGSVQLYIARSKHVNIRPLHVPGML
jgi:hypothetical protein